MAMQSSSSPSMARAIGAAAKGAISSCARRATATPKEGPSSPAISNYVADPMGSNSTATEASNSVTAAPAPAGTVDPEVLANETEVDPQWRKYVHIRPDAPGKSSLEHCISEWHKERYDAHGNPFTLTARERSEDLGSHLVYLQEAFVLGMDRVVQGVRQQACFIDGLDEKASLTLASLAARVEAVENAMAKLPELHAISTPVRGDEGP